MEDRNAAMMIDNTIIRRIEAVLRVTRLEVPWNMTGDLIGGLYQWKELKQVLEKDSLSMESIVGWVN